MKWIDITGELTEDGAEKIKTGQVLIFDYEGSKTYIKVVSKRKGKVWAIQTRLYAPEEVKVVSVDK